MVSSKPFSFEIDILPSANEDPRMRRLLGKYIEFTYPIKGGKQHFGINYIAKFYQADTFELPKVKIEFTNQTRNLYGIEGDVTVSEGEIFCDIKTRIRHRHLSSQSPNYNRAFQRLFHCEKGKLLDPGLHNSKPCFESGPESRNVSGDSQSSRSS